MNVLMIVGSAKSKVSTSEKIGNYVLDKLSAEGHTISSINAAIILAANDGDKVLIDQAKSADSILFTFPLYVDSLPAPLTKACEILSKNIKDTHKEVIAIANSGFPEPKQNFTALDILESFARQSGLNWVCGLAVGAGAALASKRPKKLEEHGGMVAKLAKSLDEIVAMITKDVSSQGHKTVCAQPLPRWMYTMMGDAGWRSSAKRRGLKKNDLLARPLFEAKL